MSQIAYFSSTARPRTAESVTRGNPIAQCAASVPITLAATFCNSSRRWCVNHGTGSGARSTRSNALRSGVAMAASPAAPALMTLVCDFFRMCNLVFDRFNTAFRIKITTGKLIYCDTSVKFVAASFPVGFAENNVAARPRRPPVGTQRSTHVSASVREH